MEEHYEKYFDQEEYMRDIANKYNKEFLYGGPLVYATYTLLFTVVFSMQEMRKQIFSHA